jgi:hypothetical protein
MHFLRTMTYRETKCVEGQTIPVPLTLRFAYVKVNKTYCAIQTTTLLVIFVHVSWYSLCIICICDFSQPHDHVS